MLHNILPVLALNRVKQMNGGDAELEILKIRLNMLLSLTLPVKTVNAKQFHRNTKSIYLLEKF